MSSTLVFYVNGAKIEDSKVDPEWTVAKYLRQNLHLRGTKLACEEGACGSCTVALAKYDPVHKKPRHTAINACLMPVFALHGCAITTVEGLGSVKNGLHPVQDRLARGHGSQCGFCTPGFVMSFYCLLRNNQQPTAKQIEEALEGNLCRCTGYRPILESFYSFGKKCGGSGNDCCSIKQRTEDPLVNWSNFPQYDATQDPIFPPELQLSNEYKTQSLILKGPRVTFYSPTTVKSLLKMRTEHPEAQIIAAGTLMGLIDRQGVNPHPVWISTARIEDWQSSKQTTEGIEVGATTTITGLQCALQEAIEVLPDEKTRNFKGILYLVEHLGSLQLRNACTFIGNLAIGSPNSDIAVPFMAAKCKVHTISSNGGERWINIDQELFTGKTEQPIKIGRDELIDRAMIPFSGKSEHCFTYKHQHIKHCAAFWVKFSAPNTVSDIRLTFGNMGNRPILALKTAKQLVGKKWDDNLLSVALSSLGEELALPESVPGGSAKYRTSLCLSFMYRFYHQVRAQLHKDNAELYELTTDLSCINEQEHQPVKPLQLYTPVSKDQDSLDPFGRPLMHQHADKHTTGEAAYTADLEAPNMLHMALVQSTCAHAKVLSVDASEALKLSGVVSYIDSRDIPQSGSNTPGPDLMIPDDTRVFSEDMVTSYGQLIGAIVAEDVTTARRAVQLVKVQYEKLKPILTIEEAINAESYIGAPVTVVKSDVESGLKNSELKLSGEIKMGSQEHFYMETQSSLVIPKEGNEYEAWVSTQWTSLAQQMMARLLGIPENNIAVKAKRLGGGFGGKGLQFLYALCPAAIAAAKLQRPVHCHLSRKEDMKATGGRHAALAKYEVGFDKTGRIQALDMQVQLNAGHSVDGSPLVLFAVVNSADHCYDIPAAKVTGRAVRTNTRSNTAFRGLGQPQANFIIDSVLERIGQEVGITGEKVREINFCQEDYARLAGDHVVANNLNRCWEECKNWSKYEQLSLNCHKFNKENKFKKQGVSLVSVHWPMGHGGHLEQGAALVHIYTDGSVLISHGGIEMGQGLNNKCLQIASMVMRLPIDRFTIIENDSSKVPNNAPTAGSLGCDLFGLAVKEACEILLKRLEPIMKDNPKGTWEDWVKSAWSNRISLSATGHGVPNRRGLPAHGMRYYTSGATMTHVEVDCLTGEHVILASDIVMDVGDSLNPAIDIGQIEGAYVQGLGLFTTEEVLYSSDGRLLTDSAGKYTMPTVSTVPRSFRVALLKNSGATLNIYSSKGVGEPPLCMGMGVYFAINQAIQSARAQNGLEPTVHIESPLTAERIRMNCGNCF